MHCLAPGECECKEAMKKDSVVGASRELCMKTRNKKGQVCEWIGDNTWFSGNYTPQEEFHISIKTQNFSLFKEFLFSKNLTKININQCSDDSNLASCRECGRKGRRPLDMALLTKNDIFVNHLVDHGAERHFKEAVTALVWASVLNTGDALLDAWLFSTTEPVVDAVGQPVARRISEMFSPSSVITM